MELTTRQLLYLLHHSEITNNQRFPTEEYAGDFALRYVRDLLQRRNVHRRRQSKN